MPEACLIADFKKTFQTQIPSSDPPADKWHSQCGPIKPDLDRKKASEPAHWLFPYVINIMINEKS